jgi:hypothetical protein
MALFIYTTGASLMTALKLLSKKFWQSCMLTNLSKFVLLRLEKIGSCFSKNVKNSPKKGKNST